MPSLQAELTPVDRLDAIVPLPQAAIEPGRAGPRLQPPRVIEIGEVTAGIAVPEDRGVRFFSSSRDFDGLDGIVFRTVEQAARAARERIRAQAGSGIRGATQRLRST